MSDADPAVRLAMAREAFVAGDWPKLAEALETTAPEGRGQRLRYGYLADALLATPDPTHAIAHQVGDEAGRIDALAARLAHVEAQLVQRGNRP